VKRGPYLKKLKAYGGFHMPRPRLPRDPRGKKIYDEADPYLLARKEVRDRFPQLMKVALDQAEKGESAFLVRLLNHLEDQPTRLPSMSADSNAADMAEDIAKWAAVGGVSVETARRMIALLKETHAFVKRSKTIDAMIAAYEKAGQRAPDRVHAMKETA